LLMVDEIDALSRHTSSKSLFVTLLKTLLAKPKLEKNTSEIQAKNRKIVAAKKPIFKDSHMYVTVVGIANSVELFQGEIFSAQDQLRAHRSAKKVFICQNEQKLLFKPYTRDEISAILTGLA
jgi:Cdc6-like AAA superfamily ATPase